MQHYLQTRLQRSSCYIKCGAHVGKRIPETSECHFIQKKSWHFLSYTMVSTETIALLLNFIVLSVVVFSERLLSVLLHRLLTLRLLQKKPAPIPHERDSTIPFLVCSLIKYSKFPGACQTPFRIISISVLR